MILNRQVVFVAMGVLAAILAFAATRGNPTLPAPEENQNTTSTSNTSSSTGPMGVNEKVIITEIDTGKTFQYTKTSKFMVILDENKYPLPQAWNCDPAGIIGYTSNISPDSINHYPVDFQAVKEGICMLTNKDFRVTIEVVD